MIAGLSAAAIEAMQSGTVQTATLAIYEPVYPHTILATLTNANILSNSLSVSKSCSSNGSIELGGMIADELRVSVKSDALASITVLNKMVRLSIRWDVDSNTTRSITVYSGIITEVQKRKANIYDITALDSSVVFDRKYHLSELTDYTSQTSPMTFPVTAEELLCNIIRCIGAPYVGGSPPLVVWSTPGVNRNVEITDIDETMGYTYRQILKWLGQLMCVNFRMAVVSPDVVEAWIYYAHDPDMSLGTAITPSNSYSLSIGDENQPIEGVDVIFGEETLYNAGWGVNVITVADNALLDGLYQNSLVWNDIAYNISDSIHESLTAVGYYSAECRCTSMWYLEPGDIIYVYDEPNNRYILAPITSVTHKLNGATTINAAVPSSLELHAAALAAFGGSQLNQLNTLEQRLRNEMEARVQPLYNDYIIEEGTSGIWTYRKWSSGISECWGSKPCSLSMSTLGSQYGIGGLFYNSTTGSNEEVTFPSNLFTAAPVVTATCNTGTNTMVSMNDISATHCLPRFWTPFTSSTSVTLNLKIYAVGRYQ